MKLLAEFVIRLLNLLEAEARAAKRHAFRLAVAVLVFATAAVLLAAGGLALAVALFLALDAVMHPAAALLTVGLLLLLGATTCIFVALYMLQRKTREKLPR